MSWFADFMNPDGRPTEQREADSTPRVLDATGKMVSMKKANQPYLAHKQWREKEAERKAAKALRKQERADRLARGEPGGPEEPEDDEEIGCLGLLKFFFYLIIAVALASKFVTGDWIWEYRGKWLNLSTYLPAEKRYFSERMLAKYDGSDPSLPIYIAIDSTVYDVTAGAKTYGKGGSYNTMAGVDATRSYATGCFKTHRTHDLRGLTEAELNGIKHWMNFFENHHTYRKVGRVIHPPIDPNSPIPEPCKPKQDDRIQDKSVNPPGGGGQRRDTAEL